MQVRKAVLPVAGLGTRLLPATKTSPKEMLPVVDKPLIQYIVEEAARAGITEMIFVTSASKPAIVDYFNHDIELENYLQEHGKNDLLTLLQEAIPSDIHVTHVFQEQPMGLGDAILCAEEIIAGEPFVVLLADVLIQESGKSCIEVMCQQFASHKNSMIAVHEVPWSEVTQYGIVSVKGNERGDCVESIVEKPTVSQTPSNLAVLGRYLFTPEIFACLKETELDHRGEVQLTDGIARLLQRESVYIHQFSGKQFDCGSKLGYLKAIVEYGMQHPEIGKDFVRYLQSIR